MCQAVQVSQLDCLCPLKDHLDSFLQLNVLLGQIQNNLASLFVSVCFASCPSGGLFAILGGFSSLSTSIAPMGWHKVRRNTFRGTHAKKAKIIKKCWLLGPLPENPPTFCQKGWIPTTSTFQFWLGCRWKSFCKHVTNDTVIWKRNLMSGNYKSPLKKLGLHLASHSPTGPSLCCKKNLGKSIWSNYCLYMWSRAWGGKVANEVVEDGRMKVTFTRGLVMHSAYFATVTSAIDNANMCPLHSGSVSYEKWIVLGDHEVILFPQFVRKQLGTEYIDYELGVNFHH